MFRTIRDTAVGKRLKRRYEWRCQVCGERIPCGGETFYIEAHHIRPLGKHDGLDNSGNMLVLCPNHHAMFDLGLPRFISRSEIEIGRERIKLTCEHKIAHDNIDYYMASICRRLG